MDTKRNNTETTSIVLGRFNIIHPGHIHLIRNAKNTCTNLIICIGSAQQAFGLWHLSIEERIDQMREQLLAIGITDAKIVQMTDPDPIDNWPEVLFEACGRPQNATIFRSENDISERQFDRIYKLGMNVSFLSKIKFFWPNRNGTLIEVQSSTDIRNILLNIG